MELTDIVAKINCIRDLKILGRVRVRDLTARFLLKYLENFYCRWSYSLFPELVAQLFLLLETKLFRWSKNAKTATVFLTCFDTTTFLQNLVLKWRQYHVFPAKVTLVCACSLLFYEKISYSFLSSVVKSKGPYSLDTLALLLHMLFVIFFLFSG